MARYVVVMAYPGRTTTTALTTSLLSARRARRTSMEPRCRARLSTTGTPMSRPGASGAPTHPGLPAVTPTDRETQGETAHD